MGFKLTCMCLLLLATARSTTFQDVMGWQVRYTWNDFAAAAEEWRSQWTPYTTSAHNKDLVKATAKRFHAWEGIMKQIGDL